MAIFISGRCPETKKGKRRGAVPCLFPFFTLRGLHIPSRATADTITIASSLYSTYAILASNDPIFPDDLKVENDTPVIPENPGGNGGGGGNSSSHTVKIEKTEHGKVTVNNSDASKGDTVIITVKPDKGCELGTLTVTDKNGNELKLKDLGDNKYSYVQPSAQPVTVKATFVRTEGTDYANCPKDETCPIHRFTDASPKAWYHDGVHYCVENGLMNGTGATAFAPDGATTRAMIVTILYRLEGTPKTSGSSYPDVAAGQYYTDAVAWAAENGVVTGYTNGNFGPNDPITREQMAAILYRYAGFKGYDVSARADLGKFSDSAQVSAYTVEPLSWANAEGLVTGKGEGILDPKGFATRAPMANEDVLAAYDRRARAFLAAEQERYPAVNLRVSCGVYPILDRDLMSAIDGANMARKEAKRKKSVPAVLFDHSILEEQEKLRQAEEEIDFALQKGYFTFFLQPKVNLLTGEIVGAEALARRITPEQEIIYPDYFLPILEENGRIVELDFLIFTKVCAFLSERLEKGLPVVCTSVNLSRLHIGNADTAERLHAIAQKHRVPPSLLELELTETILLDEFSGAKALIDALRSYGYRVSIDDFGSGYAGVNIWQQLSFDTLKLDRLFLAEEEPYRTRNRAIVPNVINIAQRLHIEVICEGVENGAQCEYLLRMGCTLVQGFLFSRPTPPDEFYRTYEEKQGHYFWGEEHGGGVAEPPAEVEKPAKKKRALRAPPDFLLPVLCAAFLTLCVTLTLSIYRNIVTEMFSGSVQHNLESYIDGQTATTQAEISELEGTVKAVAALVEERQDVDLIASYIETLNQYETTPIRFTRADDYDELIRQEQIRREWVEDIMALEKGDVYVSDIAFTCQNRDAYCFSVAAPLYIGDKFVGGLRAMVDSDMLLSTEQYASPYGHVLSSHLTDSRGTLIRTNENRPLPAADLDALLAPYHLTQEREREIRRAVASDSAAASFLLGERGGVRDYLTVASLGRNGWNTLVLFRADRAAGIIDNLFRQTVVAVAVLMAAILAVCVIIALYLNRQRKKRGIDAQRYQLLEQFSDTVLFDYDCKTDVIRFTSNAKKLFHMRALTEKDFVKTLHSSFIYPGDYFAVEEALSGRAKSVAEFRIRIKHPTEDRYFWCLVQYKYLFVDGRPNSIIGKLVDIDELIRHEEYLIEQSEKDGLTGLLNRTAIELLIQQYIQEDSAGVLFMLDIDNFKQVNDEYGHDEGDRALRVLARCLRSVFRTEDIIGRVGGDELVIYVRQSSSRTMAEQRAELLLKLLGDHADGLKADLTLSMGIACYPLDGTSYDSLFQAADRAMYRAKRLGKNQYCFAGGEKE